MSAQELHDIRLAFCYLIILPIRILVSVLAWASGVHDFEELLQDLLEATAEILSVFVEP